ncbi:MAG: NADH-quinone oxidoreductase subunit C [Actinobacteria bacterium]|nr:NADH-quinone oxidoreductase subunit C [Actinomycetota bacterium]
MEIIQKLEEKFNKKIIKCDKKSERRIYLDINPADLTDFAQYIFRDMGARFAIASGVDTPKGIEILYHFSFDSSGLVLSLRILLDRNSPEVESLTPIFKAAEWIECEINELLGVNFRNHPNLRHLLLPDDWPKGNYPLRRK